MSGVQTEQHEAAWNVPCVLDSRTLRADVVVIGGGSAGLTAAQLAAGAGKSVMLVERDRLGGECLFTGCVPSKTLLALARRVHTAKNSEALGLASLGAPCWKTVQNALERSIWQFQHADSPRAVQHSGVEVVKGEVRFVARRTLELQCGDHTHRITGREFVLATGSQVIVPPIAGLRDVDFLTHETLFELPAQPGHLLVVGGGAVGCEMAQAFVRLGSDVTLVHSGDRLLPHDEPEASLAIYRALQSDGVRVFLKSEIERVERAPDGVCAHLRGGRALEASHLLLATGKRPRVENLGLEVIGAQFDEHGLKVNARMRSVSCSYLRGAGDVVGGPMFTHGATERGTLAGLGTLGVIGRLLARLRAGQSRAEDIPWVTYTEPEVAHWGMTEHGAVKRYGQRVTVVEYDLRRLDRAITEGEGGFIKLVALKGWLGTPLGLRVIGAQAVSSRGGELIQLLSLPSRLGFHPLRLALLPAPYPTFSEAVRQSYLGFVLQGHAFGRRRAGRLNGEEGDG